MLSPENVAFAALGWLSAIFSSMVLEWNRTRRSAVAIRRALIVELKELSNRLAHVAYQLALQTSTIDQELLTWLRIAHERYDGLNRNEKLVEVLRTLEENPEQLARDVAIMRLQNPNKSIGLKKYPAPAVDAAIKLLTELPYAEQSVVLEIRTYLATFDILVDDARQYHAMTFDESLATNNRSAVKKNLETAYKDALDVCRTIVDLAAQIVWPKSG
jgi:hypothetical protein